ncbi:MAG: ParB/RepB/Spo0J family partition protein [Oligoflexus sp.]
MPDKEISKSSKKGALGKGLNSLLGLGDDQQGVSLQLSGEKGATGEAKAIELIHIPIEKIQANPNQPRKIFREEELEELTQSLKEDGIVQPLVVARDGDGYILIAGERRWRASKRAGLKQVPALIKDVTPLEMLRIAIIENVQRSNLNVIEEAEAYAALIQDFGLTQDECAKKVGKDRATISNLLRVLNLPKEIQEDLSENRMSMGHGRALLSLTDRQLMLKARDMVIQRCLNVRQTEQLVKKIKSSGLESMSEPKENSSDLDYLADSLRSHLRTKVKFSGTGARGRIEISYFSAAELERLLQLIGGKHFSF